MRGNNPLRPDAQPTRWDRLSPPQREAVKRLFDLMAAALDDLPNPGQRAPRSSRLPWLDRHRATRLAFIDGFRGTGKTTVLATVIESVDGGPQDAHMPNPPATEVPPGLLDRLRRHVVWLEPIDVEPETDDTSLLGAVMARIEQALGDYSGRTRKDAFDDGNELEAGSAEDLALSRFRRVQNKLTVAWGRQGLPAGDSDAFQIEARRRELAKLGIHHELEDALAELGRTVLRARAENPMFVLPVDDLDLNPVLCVKLLDLLRAITVPRLFVIALGSIPLTTTVMKLSYAEKFKRTGADLAWVSMHADEVRECSAQVAASNLRKLIPPDQRVALRNVGVRDAFRFYPLGQLESTAPLAELLSEVRLTVASVLRPFAVMVAGTEHPSLLDVLTTSGGRRPPRSPDKRQAGAGGLTDAVGAADTGALLSCYSGLNALTTTPRRLADLWLILHRLGGSPAPTTDAPDFADHLANQEVTRRAVGELLGFFRQTVQEEPALLAVATEKLDSRTPPTGAVVARPSLGPPVVARHDFPGRYEFRASSGWDLFRRPDASPGNRDSAQPPLAAETLIDVQPALVAAAIVYHDIAKASSDDFGLALLDTNPERKVPWARTIWEATQGDDLGEVVFPWPALPCSTFWQLDWFLYGWSARIDQVAHRGEGAHDAAWTWLDLGTALVDGHPARTTGTDWGSLFAQKGRFSTLLAGVRESSRDGASLAAQAWLLAAGGFLLPEFGLDLAEVVNRDLVAFYKREQRSLFQAHRQRINALAAVNPQAARECVKRVSHGPWQLAFPNFGEFWRRRPLTIDESPSNPPANRPVRARPSKRRA